MESVVVAVVVCLFGSLCFCCGLLLLVVLLFNVVVENEGCLSVCMCAFLFRPSGRPAHLPAFVPQRVQSTKRNVNMAHGMVGGGSGSQQTEARIRTGWFPVDVDVGVGSVIVTIIIPLASLLLLLLLTTRQRRQCAANYDQNCNHHQCRLLLLLALPTSY